MSIATFIRDNTDDGRNIVRFLIAVMNGDIEGCTLSQQLAAARLLTIYGQDDADDFIAENTPDRDETKNGRRMWLEIDEGLRNLIKARTDDGRVICMFLIDVMEGKYEGTQVGHRVSAARELLSRAFGKPSSPRRRGPARSLPRATKPAAPRRSTPKKSQMTPEKARFQAAVDERLATQAAVLDEPRAAGLSLKPSTSLQSTSRTPKTTRSTRSDSGIFEACYDDNFDPYEAAANPAYAESYTGCPDPECEVHGNPPPLDFDLDPNDHHY